MKISEILDQAVSRLITHGWCQGTLGLNDGPNCVTGAILRVLGGEIYHRNTNIGDYCSILECYSVMLDTIDSEFTATLKALENVVGHSVPYWNDQSSRTLPEIISTMQMLAAKLRGEELEANRSALVGAGSLPNATRNVTASSSQPTPQVDRSCQVPRIELDIAEEETA